MFKEVKIHLSGPICKCSKEQIAWSILENSILKLKCRRCGIQLVIPREEFIANYIFDLPYPDDIPDSPELKAAMSEVDRLLKTRE